MIEGIEFGLLSPALIKKMASCEITKPELYDADGFPVEGGLRDLRLGVIDPGMRCRVCNGRIGECLGHFGYLELAKPVINPLYAKRIYKILKLTCRKCGRVLVDESGKFDENIKVVKCPHCGEKQKEIVFEKPLTIMEGDKRLTPEEIRERLEKIPDEDLEILKIKGGRPEWLVLTVLPIPPVTVRPSITFETGGKSEDDLTHKLVDIVRINDRLKKNIELGAPEFIINDIWELLQYHVATYIDNELPGIPPARHRSGRALKTLIQRLEKKEGRFRGNLTGKRVNFAARSVISPDPMIGINEVGVPLVVAKELTIPVIVTKDNIEEIRKYVLNGSNYPGANYVIRPDGLRKKITEENKEEIAKELTEGYIVERHLINGDIGIFNRQPSLHRMSMMAHYVRVTPWKTFTLNLPTTIPYNADFDGDEMNFHVPQTEEARVEAEELMVVEKHIRSPRYGKPVIALKHDHISGLYLLTKEKKLSKKEVTQLLLAAFGHEYVLKMKDEIREMSGKELFSLILPSDLNIEFKSAAGVGTEDEIVVIKNGKLIKGVIDENAVGEQKGKLLSKIEYQFGHEEAKKFLESASRMALEYLSMKGFTISLADSDISENAKNRIEKICKEKEEEFEAKRAMIDEDTILSFGSEIVNSVSKIIKEEIKDNNVVHMAKSGARGSYVTITQMSGIVGQKVIEGRIIDRGYINRTTSHFEKGKKNLRGYGFVFGNYKDGLDPIGFFFDAASSRENLMDKSLQTRHSGYMERRLVNTLQDLYVDEDLTVKDSHGMIIQFLAGEDGLDPWKSESGKLLIEDFIFEKEFDKDLLEKASKIEIPKKIMEDFEEYCRKKNISDSKKDEYLKKLKLFYLTRRYEPWEAIGIVAAQSISEPATQMTMRSYTLASLVGRLVKVVQGLPKLIEVFDLRKAFEKSMTIYLKENNKEVATKIAKEIEERSIEDIVKTTWLDLFNMQIGMEFETVAQAEKIKDILEKYGEVARRENTITIKINAKDIRNLRKIKEKILKTKISGVEGIKRAVVTKIGDEWIIRTEGSNLREILEKYSKYIDTKRTTTDDIMEIYEIFGIEAARNAIAREVKKTLDEQGLEVDIRHILLVADIMCFDGKPKPIGRYGVAGAKPSVLARANFEETKKHLSMGAFYGVRDELKGVVENVMIGKIVPVGTGNVKLLLDLEKIKKLKEK
ncbi:MAG: DNA-directed RNA polymerase subunit A' [Candidatus Aenigmatarchaeota archaeon]